MYIVKGIFILVFFLFCCIEVGKLWHRTGSYLEAALLGLSTMMAIFNVFCVPFHFMQVSFRILTVLFSVILGGLVVLSVVLSIRMKKKYTLFSFRPSFQLFFVLALALIGFQIFRLVAYQPVIYGDDVTYISMINDIKNTGLIQGLLTKTGEVTPPWSSKYMLTSYYPFLAYWCTIFDFHPLLFCKTFFPVLTTLFTYSVFWLFAEYFFHEDMRKKSIMLLLSAMMVEFGNISYHFFSRKVLQWPWQSKSFLYTILMPFLLYLAIRCTEEGMKKTEIAMLAVVLFANGAASLMGVGYSTIMLFLVGLVMCVHKRSIGVLGKTVLSVVPTGVFLIFCVAVS